MVEGILQKFFLHNWLKVKWVETEQELLNKSDKNSSPQKNKIKIDWAGHWAQNLRFKRINAVYNSQHISL